MVRYNWIHIHIHILINRCFPNLTKHGEFNVRWLFSSRHLLAEPREISISTCAIENMARVKKKMKSKNTTLLEQLQYPIDKNDEICKIDRYTNNTHIPFLFMCWNICVTNDHEYVPLLVNTSRSFPHSWLITSGAGTAYTFGAPEMLIGV